VYQGYQNETLARFLRAREGSVPKAHKMVNLFFDLEIFSTFLWKTIEFHIIYIYIYFFSLLLKFTADGLPQLEDFK
jgi:CRAL/TRIO, N-terminal domain